MKKESFCKKVKEELCLTNSDDYFKNIAILSAYIKINGSILIKNGSKGIILKSENPKITKFIYGLITLLFKSDIRIEYIKKGNCKTTTYVITFFKGYEEILSALNVDFFENKISRNIVDTDSKISGYLLGAFLACGSINSPLTSNYHFELAVNNENYAKWLSKLFAKYKNSNIEPKIIKRRNKVVVYFKKGDQIANFLIMVGAVNACMEFENLRINRDFNNSANRLANSDMANMKKIIDTANRQIEEIKAIDKSLGINNISNVKERELCYLRLSNESASLNELAVLLSDKLKRNISKSNINHLFRHIHERYVSLCK